MEFTIYDISELSDDELENFDFEKYSNLPELEMGLSAGETRQSLLDRFKEEIKSEKPQFININLGEYGIDLDDENLETEDEQALSTSEIENVLYDFDDEELSSSVWYFASEIIYIRGEEWWIKTQEVH